MKSALVLALALLLVACVSAEPTVRSDAAPSPTTFAPSPTAQPPTSTPAASPVPPTAAASPSPPVRATQAAASTPPPAVSPTATAAPGKAAAPRTRELACGEVIRESVVLSSDLTCSGDALIVEASGITIDLGKRTLRGPGPGSPTWPRPNLQSVGVKVVGQTDVVVRNGTIERFSSGVLFDGVKGSRIEEIETRDNYYGVYLKSSEANLIAQSVFVENVYGPTLYESNGNRIESNQMNRQRHLSPGGYGLYVYGSTGNTFVGNTIDSNVNWGIWLSSSSKNVFFHNNVIDNRPQVSDDSGENVWYDAQTREGNYWADWEGQEIPGTGIGNHSYLIWGPGGAADLYPFVRKDGWKEPNRRPAPAAAAPIRTPVATDRGPWLALPGSGEIASASADGTALDARVPLGRLASNVAWSPDGRYVYAVDAAPPSASTAAAPSGPLLLTIDARTGAIVRTDPAPSAASRVHVIPDRDGRSIHLLDGAAVATFDTTTRAWRAPLGYPADVASAFASWKHQLLLVANRRTLGVDLVWIGGRRISYTIPMPGAPLAMVANRAGTRLYAAVAGEAAIPVVETEQYAVVDRLRPDRSDRGWRSLATSPDGGRLYGLREDGELFALDLPGGGIRFRRPLGGDARQIAASPDGARLYATVVDERRRGALLVLRAEDGLEVARLDLPSPPEQIASPS